MTRKNRCNLSCYVGIMWITGVGLNGHITEWLDFSGGKYHVILFKLSIKGTRPPFVGGKGKVKIF